MTSQGTLGHSSLSDSLAGREASTAMDQVGDSISALFEAYQAAIVSTLDPVHGWVDPALACLERDQPAVVLTAWNPGLERPSLEVNRQRNERLHALLQSTGCQIWRADGFDPGTGATEEGFLAWGLDPSAGRALARQFWQLAIYAYDRDGMRHVLAC